MNILVDGRAICRYSAGITTFIQGALFEWARQRPLDRFYVVLPKPVDNRFSLPADCPNIVLLNCYSTFFRYVPNIILLQFIVPFLVRKLRADIYFAPVPHLPFFMPKRTKTIVVAHDVVNLEYANTMSLTNRLATTGFFRHAVTNADRVWCNSLYTKSKIELYFPKRKDNSMFVGCSVSRDEYNVSCDASGIVSGISGDYVLFVGSLEPRKNLTFLLDIAPELFRRHGLLLVVVGCNHWKDSLIRNIVEADGYPRECVLFTGYVTNAELASLYRNARCFVSASFNEGFGMPVLEAMLCGCPVVVSHNSAMIELTSGVEGAVSIEGYDRETWITAISEMVSRPRIVNHDTLEKYDWRKIVKSFLELN